MNIIQKVNLFLKIKSVLNKLLKEGKKMTDTPGGTKPGYKTTEFWLIVLSNLTTIVTALKGVISPEKSVVVLAILNGIYTILRSLVKQPNITTFVEKK